MVIPLRDEAQCVSPVLSEVHRVLRKFQFEVVCVDDASSDGTLAQLMRAKKRFGRTLRIFSHSEPAGQSAALHTAVDAARAPWIVTMDGDGQNDPADIPRLVRIRDEARCEPLVDLIVCGVRCVRADSFTRRAASRLANVVRSRVLNDGIRDTGCGLKLFSKDSFLRLPYFDHMHRFLPALMQRQGGTMICIDVNHRPRLAGESKYGISDRLWPGILDLLGVMWLRRRASFPSVEEMGIPCKS